MPRLPDSRVPVRPPHPVRPAHRPITRRRGTLPRLLIGVLAVAQLVAPAAAAPRDVVRVDGAIPESALLAAPDARLDAPMLRRLQGVRGVLDRRSLVRLAAASRPTDAEPAGPPIARLTLVLSDGHTATADLTPIDERRVLVARADTAERAELPRELLDAVAPGWSISPPVGTGPTPGAVADLPGPYVESAEQLTGAVVRRRLSMRDTRLPATGPTRDLSAETLWVRLPEGHDPARPAGLIVWISPSPRWRLPEEFGPTLDELGIIAVGADNAGNDRAIIDRLQLVLDAVATAQHRWLIDERRVYLTGFSGGGRCSSILLYAYPDRFAGALPIVGLNSWHRLPLPGGRALPAGAPMPEGDAADLARTRRLFAISGTEDFNLAEMRSRTELLEKFGCPVRLEVVDGMKHEQMPPAELIARALRWIDQPQDDKATRAAEDAATALAAHDRAYGSEDRTDKAVASLNALCRDHPWTPAALEAAERLGVASVREMQP
jgi:predicted esterase